MGLKMNIIENSYFKWQCEVFASDNMAEDCLFLCCELRVAAQSSFLPSAVKAHPSEFISKRVRIEAGTRFGGKLAVAVDLCARMHSQQAPQQGQHAFSLGVRAGIFRYFALCV